jgi:hypothetical protein
VIYSVIPELFKPFPIDGGLTRVQKDRVHLRFNYQRRTQNSMINEPKTSEIAGVSGNSERILPPTVAEELTTTFCNPKVVQEGKLHANSGCTSEGDGVSVGQELTSCLDKAGTLTPESYSERKATTLCYMNAINVQITGVWRNSRTCVYAIRSITRAQR